MKKAIIVVALFLIAVCLPGFSQSGQASKGRKAVAPDLGDCCLCILTIDASGDPTWACPCNLGAGANSCSISSEGCTNVGICLGD